MTQDKGFFFCQKYWYFLIFKISLQLNKGVDKIGIEIVWKIILSSFYTKSFIKFEAEAEEI